MTPTVAIIGAGPVGQSAALLLARFKVRAVVLDSRPERDLIGSKAICQHGDVLDIWETVGAGRRIAGEGVTWTTARTFYRDRELFSQTFDDRGSSPFPPFVNISQSRTETILDEAISRQPLIEVRWGHEVTGVEQDQTGVRLRCSTTSGGEEVVAEYAIVCAGAKSDALREALGLTFEGRSFDDYFLICDIRAELPGWRDERRFYFDPKWNPGRQVLIHPCPDSTFRIDWQVAPGFDLDAELAAGGVHRRVTEIIGERPYRVEWQSLYRFHSRHVDRMRIGRILVAGDCAHLFSPFGARGLNSGVQDAENAAWKLAYVLKGWAPPTLLASYDLERLDAAHENIAVTSSTMEFLVPESAEKWAARDELLRRAVHDPDACANVDSGRLAEPYWYVDSPLTTPDTSRPFQGRPPKGAVPSPAPGVLIPDVAVRRGEEHLRLRSLARRGLLFVVAGDVDAHAVRAAARDAAVGPASVVSLTRESDPVAEALGVRDGEVWIVRPDAHVAAVVDADRDRIARATRRALGHEMLSRRSSR